MWTRPAEHKPIEVFLAIGVRLYRDGLAATLSDHTHLSIVGTAGSAPEAQFGVRTFRPDVIVVDVCLEDSRRLLGAVRSESPLTRVLALAVREDINAILDYAEAGADGFVTANGSVAELVEAIERTHAGELMCTPSMAAQLLRRAASRSPDATGTAAPIFTGREQQVFQLLKEGQSNKEIASALSIAEATVKNHVHHVLEKLQVSTRGRAAAVGAVRADAAGERRSPQRREVRTL
jgi:two-component system, NarL family, nitrate/nitrite response regulator NarL